MDNIQPAVKSALTKAYKQGSSSRVVRSADLITLPGLKKAPKKRIAAMLEPVENGVSEENGEALAENEEENSDSEDAGERFASVLLVRLPSGCCDADAAAAATSGVDPKLDQTPGLSHHHPHAKNAALAPESLHSGVYAFLRLVAIS
ncbi:hypothetical protein BHE74_00019083 [Ensete ventricosum]|nr:hypothetical protein GW17_00049016 [Ensete ventricosum]RWW73066.1 hypothetical protein BHE74_00019083 [Ensete ventricosum]